MSLRYVTAALAALANGKRKTEDVREGFGRLGQFGPLWLADLFGGAVAGLNGTVP